MNFLTHSSRDERFAFAFVLWPLSLLASDLAQKNQPVRSPDTPVLIWDIDLKLANDPPQPWGWRPAMELHEQLTADSCRFSAQAKKLLNFANACGTYLSRLEEKFPERFKKKHTNTGNVWMIYPSR